jgi:hypothetical protein
MELHESSTRLLPGYDDDEVESPPFQFAHFERLMAASHLAHIRHPAESTHGLTQWLTRLAPHYCFESKDFTGCDEDTFIAFELLNA